MKLSEHIQPIVWSVDVHADQQSYGQAPNLIDGKVLGPSLSLRMAIATDLEVVRSPLPTVIDHAQHLASVPDSRNDDRLREALRCEINFTLINVFRQDNDTRRSSRHQGSRGTAPDDRTLMVHLATYGLLDRSVSDGGSHSVTGTSMVTPTSSYRTSASDFPTVHSAMAFADKLAEIAVENGNLANYEDDWVASR